MRYIVTFIENDGIMDIYSVTDSKRPMPYGHLFWTTDVWASYGKPRCTSCRGPLEAMYASCPHAQAVKRHIKKYGARQNA